jgi:hypothetical protein
LRTNSKAADATEEAEGKVDGEALAVASMRKPDARRASPPRRLRLDTARIARERMLRRRRIAPP